MLRSQGPITVINANLSTGVATAGSTVGMWIGSQETAQAVASAAQYSSTKDQRTLTFNVTGTWTGTLIVQETLDGANWYTSGQLIPKAGGANAASLTANGAFMTTITGATQVRITASAVMTGQANVVAVLSADY